MKEGRWFIGNTQTQRKMTGTFNTRKAAIKKLDHMRNKHPYTNIAIVDTRAVDLRTWRD